MYGINKIFVSSVLNTHKVSSDIISKLNLDIFNICKSKCFHFIDNNKISMNFLYKMAYICYIQVKNYQQKILF